MAGDVGTLYRNHSASDTTVTTQYYVGSTLPTVESLGWSAPSETVFKEWNTSRDGTGSGFNPGEYDQTFSPALYAIWESTVENIDYITNSQEITSIANAIRTKGGTSESLVYPNGFVSAIEAIPTGGATITNSTDSHGGTIISVDTDDVTTISPLSVTENGTYTATSGNAYNPVTVNVSGTDISDTTATASDVRTGKYFYTANGTKTQGTIVTKNGSDLTASGKTVTVPAGYYASQATKDIATGSATTPATTITANPSISVNSSGLITATNSKTQSVTPTVSAGYVASGTAGTITVSGSNTSQLTTQAAQTITPTTTDQTIASGKYLTGTQTIKGDANLVAENIAKDITIFGVTGTHEGGEDISDTTATASDVRTGKYFYTAAGVKTQGSIQDQAAQTITPGTSDQTIASGKYLSGTQTIKGDANLVAENIKKDVTIFGVTGTHEGGGGGGVTTANVTISMNDSDATYYTDATMTAHAITSGDQDLYSVPLPVGSLVVLARAGSAPPMPMPMTVSGLTLVNSYSLGSRGACKIYEVTG